MRILDRERYWSFIKAYFICFFALVGLYVVIDAFSNLDEFAEVDSAPLNLFLNMGRYYLIKMSLIYDQICGVITMMAAIFTVTWMQKNNELLAMLAAGISTQRVIRPVLISALGISALAVVNQEFIMPRLAEQLQKTPDDDGSRPVIVYARQDSNDVLIQGDQADRAKQTMIKFSATIPVRVAGEVIEMQAREVHYIPEDSNLPKKGGWLIWGAKFLTSRTSGDIAEVTKGILTPIEDPSLFPPPNDKMATARPGSPAYFLKTNLSFSAITRSRQWYHFAPTIDLIRALSDPSNIGDRTDMSIFSPFEADSTPARIQPHAPQPAPRPGRCGAEHVCQPGNVARNVGGLLLGQLYEPISRRSRRLLTRDGGLGSVAFLRYGRGCSVGYDPNLIRANWRWSAW